MSGHSRPKMLHNNRADAKKSNTPTAYGGVNKGPGPGIEGGFSSFSGGGRDEKTGLAGKAEMTYVDAYAGGNSEGNFGIGGRAGLYNVEGGWEGKNGEEIKVGHNALTAEADAHIGKSDAGFALGADLIGGSIRAGTSSKDNASDESVQLSASISSPGASAHLHYGDSDGDGYREYGFDVGGKLGPGIGIKMTTEDPLRTAMTSTMMPGMGPLMKHVLPKGNMTHGAVDGAKAAGSWIGDKASSAWSGIKGFFD